MVGRRGETLDDLRFATRIQRGAGDDRLEELGADAARAGEARQQPAGAERLERGQINALVAARGVARLRRLWPELGRIETHHSDPPPPAPKGLSAGKPIG